MIEAGERQYRVGTKLQLRIELLARVEILEQLLRGQRWLVGRREFERNVGYYSQFLGVTGILLCSKYMSYVVLMSPERDSTEDNTQAVITRHCTSEWKGTAGWHHEL